MAHRDNDSDRDHTAEATAVVYRDRGATRRDVNVPRIAADDSVRDSRAVVSTILSVDSKGITVLSSLGLSRLPCPQRFAALVFCEAGMIGTARRDGGGSASVEGGFCGGLGGGGGRLTVTRRPESEPTAPSCAGVYGRAS